MVTLQTMQQSQTIKNIQARNAALLLSVPDFSGVDNSKDKYFWFSEV